MMENVTHPLEAQLLVGVPVFMLIDPMIGEPFPIGEYGEQDDIGNVLAMREAAWQRPVLHIKLNDKIKLPPALHPYLVVLNNQDDMWLTTSYEMAKVELASAQQRGVLGTGSAVHRIGGWLQSTQSPQALAEQLSELMRVNTSAHTQAKYQRMADRRAFSLLGDIVGDARLQTMLGQIQAWHYLETNGMISTCKGSGEAYQAARLNPEEWNDLMQGEAIHTVMARWQGEKHIDSNIQTCYQHVKNALQQASAAKQHWSALFQTEADLYAYAGLYLLKPDFTQQVAVQALLQKTNAEANEDITFDVLRESIYPLINTRA